MLTNTLAGRPIPLILASILTVLIAGRFYGSYGTLRALKVK